MTTSGQADSSSYNGPPSSSLSTAISNFSEFCRNLEHVEEKLGAYQTTGTRDKTLDVLRAFLDFLPLDGRRNLIDDIIGCGSDDNLRQLATHLLSAVIVPLKARVRTPAAVTPAPRFGAAADDEEMASELAESSSRNDQTWLKKACLKRDANKCVLSGFVDTKWATANLTPEQEEATVVTWRTVCAHIIPFSLGEFTDQEIPRYATTWNALFRCFPSLRSRAGLNPKSINEPFNAVTLAEMFHAPFDELRLAFDPTSEENVYRVIVYERRAGYRVFLPPSGTMTLTSHDPLVALPRAALFEAHATVAKILHARGLGEYVEKVLTDRESVRCLAADGSTDIQSLLLVF